MKKQTLNFDQISKIIALASGFDSGNNVKITSGFDYSNDDNLLDFGSKNSLPQVRVSMSDKHTRFSVKIGNKFNTNGDYHEDYVYWNKLADRTFNSYEEFSNAIDDFLKDHEYLTEIYSQDE